MNLPVMKKRLYAAALLLAAGLFCSCNGIFEGIYDTPASAGETEFGFIREDPLTRTGRIYIDATAYTEWHYISLHDKTVKTAAVGDEAAVPERWDFAVHRYDAKTCGGAVLETEAEAFGSLPPAGVLAQMPFEPDRRTDDRITVDMSQMMDGIIVYAEDDYNPVLSRWLKVDTSVMPPVYTLSNRIYVLRLQDGTCAALRLTNFMNDAAVKGFMTIDYCYPIEL